MPQNVELHCAPQSAQTQLYQLVHPEIAFAEAAMPQLLMQPLLMLAHLFTQVLRVEQMESSTQFFC